MARVTKSLDVLALIRAALVGHAWPAGVLRPAEVILGQSGFTPHLPSVGIVEVQNDEPAQNTGAAIRDQRIEIIVTNDVQPEDPEQGYTRLLDLVLEIEDVLRALDLSSIPVGLDEYRGRRYGGWVGPQGNYMESFTLTLEVRFDEPFVG